MSYQALYRVWRPQRFDEIVGQQVITQTLKNALITDQISHAYLFSGPRGTGKTSTAKILAKAVNCKNLKDGEPCNECETCVAINNGSLNDVIEIDAASNNGVEEIRNIRDKAKYAPTEADYKVYIIDEVHMLSTGAFNALLKTLEEPPAHVIFILATTEPHKIPATIISRVQRFDFKRIKTADIVTQMAKILDANGDKYDKRALDVIAKSAEGGMRDALSILDQVLSYGKDELTYDSALQVTGSVAKDDLQKYMLDVINKKVSDGLQVVSDVLDNGKDASQFIEDLIDYCQNILLYKQDPKMVADSELSLLGDKFKEVTINVTSELIYKYVEIMNDILQQIRYTFHPDVYLDILTVKLANAEVHENGVQNNSVPDEEPDEELASLKQQIMDLTNKLAQINEQPRQDPMVKDEPKKTEQRPAKVTTASKAKVNITGIFAVLDNATRSALTEYQSQWDELMNLLSVTQRAVMHVSKPVAASDSGVVVAFDYSFLYQKAVNDKDLMQSLETGMNEVFDKAPDILFIPGEQWPEIRKEYLVKNPIKQKEKKAKQVKEQTSNESVAKAKELFGDDTVNIEDD